MDLNYYLDNAVKVPRYVRLYNLAFKNKPSETSFSQLFKPKKQRRLIEIDLMKRYNKSRAKIHTRKLMQTAKITEKNTGVPKINKLKKFNSALATEEEEKQTVKGNQVSESIRKLITKPVEPVNSVLSSDSATNQSSLHLSVDLSKLSNFKRPSEKSKDITPKSTPRSIYQSSFNNLGAVCPQPTQLEDQNTFYHELEGPIATRTQVWNTRKEDKLVKLRQEKFNREIHGCSFKPDLSATLYKNQHRQLKNSSSQATIDYSSTQLTPNSKSIAFAAGFDLNGFEMKAKPLVDYRNMTQKL